MPFGIKIQMGLYCIYIYNLSRCFELTDVLVMVEDVQEEQVELGWRQQESWLFEKYMSSLLQGTWKLLMQQKILFLKKTKLRVWMF